MESPEVLERMCLVEILFQVISIYSCTYTSVPHIYIYTDIDVHVFRTSGSPVPTSRLPRRGREPHWVLLPPLLGQSRGVPSKRPGAGAYLLRAQLVAGGARGRIRARGGNP